MGVVWLVRHRALRWPRGAAQNGRALLAAGEIQGDDATLHAADAGGPPGWWTPERSRLAAWLKRNVAVLAPIYRGAVRMVFDEGFPGRVHFVSHAVREIRNRLPDAFAEVPKRVDYVKLVDVVQAAWVREDLPTDGALLAEAREASIEGPPTYDVSHSFLDAIANLIGEHTAAKGNNELKARLLLETVGDANVPDYVVKHWLQSTRWVEKRMHVGDKEPLESDEVELQQNFETFESALSAIVNRSYENMDALDELLDAANR